MEKVRKIFKVVLIAIVFGFLGAYVLTAPPPIVNSAVVRIFLGQYEIGDTLNDPGVVRLQFKGHNGKVAYLVDITDPASPQELFPPFTATAGKYIIRINNIIYEIVPISQSMVEFYKRN